MGSSVGVGQNNDRNGEIPAANLKQLIRRDPRLVDLIGRLESPENLDFDNVSVAELQDPDSVLQVVLSLVGTQLNSVQPGKGRRSVVRELRRLSRERKERALALFDAA